MRDVLGVAGEVVRDPDETMAVGLVGCGSHVYRNVLPALKYVEGLDLVATADLDERKATLYADQFGARASYTDYRQMVAEQDLDGVLVSVGLDASGRPQYPDIVPEILDAGVSVWMEKPPAASLPELERIEAAVTDEAFAQVGFKMMFTPAVGKMADLIGDEEFGEIQSYKISYALDLPREPREIQRPAARRFLDDVMHPLSEIVRLFGPPETVTHHYSGETDGFAILEHPGGFTGTFHLMGGAGRIGPAIDLQVVGEGPIAHMKGGTEIEYHRDGDWGSYTRNPDFTKGEGSHSDRFRPQLREPLGALELHSEALFGYVAELAHFAEALRSGGPQWAGIDDAIEVMKIYETFCREPGVPHAIDEQVEPEARSGWLVTRRLHCPNCGGRMRPKNGWSAVCPPQAGGCGTTEPLADDDQRLTEAETAIVEEILAEYMPEVEQPHVEFWRSDRLLVPDERTYVVLRESKDDETGYFLKLFVKYNDDFHAHEFETLDSIDAAPMAVPTVHEQGDSWCLLDYYEGQTLSNTLDDPLVETIQEVVADLAAWHERTVEERREIEVGEESRTVHYGDVHGDFDPDNVVLHGDDRIVIDWENYRSGVQEFDVLHFVAIAATVVFDDADPAEQVARMARGDEPFDSIRQAAFDTYAERRDVSTATLDSLWGAYAEYRIDRLLAESVPLVAGPDADEDALPESIYTHLAGGDWRDGMADLAIEGRAD